MKREAHITLRAPRSFAALLDKQSSALGMSRSTFIVESVRASLENGMAPTGVANPSVWDKLLKDWDKLPRRQATTEDEIELAELESLKKNPKNWMSSKSARDFVKSAFEKGQAAGTRDDGELVALITKVKQTMSEIEVLMQRERKSLSSKF